MIKQISERKQGKEKEDSTLSIESSFRYIKKMVLIVYEIQMETFRFVF